MHFIRCPHIISALLRLPCQQCLPPHIFLSFLHFMSLTSFSLSLLMCLCMYHLSVYCPIPQLPVVSSFYVFGSSSSLMCPYIILLFLPSLPALSTTPHLPVVSSFYNVFGWLSSISSYVSMYHLSLIPSPLHSSPPHDSSSCKTSRIIFISF